MLVELVSFGLVKAIVRVAAALVEGRDLGRSDASAVVSALLEAVVAGEQQTSSALHHLEVKIDQLTLQPYMAAMAAGQRLLADASPSWRTLDDRRELLANARLRFADAAGYATTARLQAYAELHYGLCWLASGSAHDAWLAFGRAARAIEEETLAAFGAAVQENLAWERNELRRKTALGQLREAVFGYDDWTAQKFLRDPDSGHSRYWGLPDEHKAVQECRTALATPFQDKRSYPLLSHPSGKEFSKEAGALLVPMTAATPVTMLGIEITMDWEERDQSSPYVALQNDRTEPVRLSATLAGEDPTEDTSWYPRLASATKRGISDVLDLLQHRDPPRSRDLLLVEPSHVERVSTDREPTHNDQHLMANVQFLSGHKPIGVVRFSLRRSLAPFQTPSEL